ncbi:carbohydrate ABC transporter permease [Streptomyces europaeiscabiei]|uniref:Sugar ABC transporter permease n=1 Tax=Streptomyces europaeiscabiei TaxID=146819 RepID=A0ABU4NK15_9ACTN|nr:sugar ABC transporter permease [Streptomyces europaeiscabiei]MDX2527395.1 sugar ABC transporter permease [Streptomyces europaeiscabiei]MDX2762004.1 sugar ABC transporter permease [Streptomyces europaeiscabiei]MDX2771739.1 sugar ABC transporter permease [Streptomyces europaeiscabiei]MDX3546016.1 sugar ABC transporter permease [Streptomyces europaeiscabiei]MDX3555705.1 sugar ABC transporter permease [Streptomyces europaeiscabiei]
MTKRASAVSASPPRRRSKYTLAPLVLIAANVVLFSLFFVWPAVIGLVYSFTNYTGVGAFQYIGLDNYHNLIGDSTFYDALTRTLLYAVLFVPLNFGLSLLAANLVVNKHAKGASVARVVFFIPWLLSPIVVGVLWRWLFGENFGLVNYVIEEFGGSAVPWQSNADLSLIVVVMAASWAWTGFSMLLFIAAIKNVPVSYYEAASLDGAGPWRQFISITLPSIAPTSFIVILLNTINAMKEYPVFVALNNGGPGTSNNLLVQYIYETGFKRGQIGYASAASFVLMLILMAVAIIQLIVNRRVENR